MTRFLCLLRPSERKFYIAVVREDGMNDTPTGIPTKQIFSNVVRTTTFNGGPCLMGMVMCSAVSISNSISISEIDEVVFDVLTVTALDRLPNSTVSHAKFKLISSSRSSNPCSSFRIPTHNATHHIIAPTVTSSTGYPVGIAFNTDTYMAPFAGKTSGATLDLVASKESSAHLLIEA